MNAVTSVPNGIYQIKISDPRFLLLFSGREFSNDDHPKFLRSLGLTFESVARIKQVHGKKVIRVDSVSEAVNEADGLMTNCPGLALGILTADCIPTFIWSEEPSAIALVHAGWRGLHQGILEEAVQGLVKNYGVKAEKLRAAFGPAIRRCCYEVGPEFQDHFPKHCVKEGDHFKMDLIEAAKDRLSQSGIPASAIQDTGICTVCERNRFFSARKEHTAERILSVMQIRKEG